MTIVHQNEADTNTVDIQRSLAPMDLSKFDGAEIRSLRKIRSLSLHEMADRCRLSIGHLSEIERNISKPSLKALSNIADALGVTVGWFFTGSHDAASSGESRIIVRKGCRRRIVFGKKSIDHLLSPALGGQLELSLTRLQPAGTSEKPYRPHGEEGGLVLQGRLEVKIGDEVFILEEGDSFQISTSETHHYRNAFEGETIVVYAVTSTT